MNKANKKIKVLITMSGGVDSSVAAALLVAKGYDVTGAFMVNYDEIGPGGESCWAGDYQDALRAAAKLGIPLLRWDFVQEYRESVLDYMFAEYKKGRTPNPDVLCNKFVKFGFWLDKAKKLGFDFIATGHYARTKKSKNLIKLMTAKDDNKDQTYFLHQLNQKQLQHILFPIGDYTKPEVRKLAKKFGLPNADKEESMGICFVGEVPMKDFLLKKIKSQPGKIVMSTGEIIGEHDGLPFYTIGQRNLGVKTKENKPLYVVDKNFAKNELVVGYEDNPLLYKKEAEVGEINWIEKEIKLPLTCEVRLRHRQPLQKCTVSLSFPPQAGIQTIQSDTRSPIKLGMINRVFIKFAKPQRAVTPGQFAVFYKKGECLGGGVIE